MALGSYPTSLSYKASLVKIDNSVASGDDYGGSDDDRIIIPL
jgi:hypothetical protein